MIVKYLVLIGIFIQQGLSWWDNGHMITAQIAEIILQENHPKIYNAANKMVKAMNGLDSDLNNNFVTCSVWADDIKDKAMSFWENWHYYDRPVNPDGVYLQQDAIEAQSNACTALERAVDEIVNSDGTKITTQKAVMIRFIIHIVGDVHQPLHSSNFYNETFSDSIGDMGGNLQNIVTLEGVAQNLHAYWDQGAEVFQTRNYSPISRPLNENDKQYLIDWAQNLMDKYPQEIFGDLANDLDFYNWTRESWEFGQNTTYPLLQKTNKFDEEYQKNAQEVCRQRVTLAGYRLANLLVEIFQGYTQVPNTNQTQDLQLETQIREKIENIFQKKYKKIF